MNSLHDRFLSGRWTLTRIAALALTGIAFCSRESSAQDYRALPEPEFIESVTAPSDPSWGLFWNKSRAIRYGSALTHCTRLYQRHMPVCPPVCHPSFGYHNPCWRQIPVDRRCQPCEVMRSNWTSETMPILPGPPTSVEPPPAPEVSLPLPSPDRKPLPKFEPAKY